MRELLSGLAVAVDDRPACGGAVEAVRSCAVLL